LDIVFMIQIKLLCSVDLGGGVANKGFAGRRWYILFYNI